MCCYTETNNTGEDGRGGSRSGSECAVTERQTVQVRMAEEGPEAEQNVSLHSSLSAAVRGGTWRYNEQRSHLHPGQHQAAILNKQDRTCP